MANIALRLTTAAAVLGLGSVAFAQEAVVETAPTPLASGPKFSLKLEPGLATALSKPQTSRTELGMGHTVQLLFGLSRYVAIGPSIGYTQLPPDGVMTESGKAWTFGAGGRLMRPHDAVGYYGLSPWIDANALYVRTGDLDRPGFATGAGVSMPLDRMRKYWFGPYARYSQIVQGDREGFDNRDAKILAFGLGLEITPGLARKQARVAMVVTAPVEPIIEEPPPAEPIPVVVEAVVPVRPKLDVSEKIAFLWDSAKLEPSSHVALDEVVASLKANPGFKVQVDGHASSDGDDAHNQTLSLQRADTVLDYLVAHGIAKSRLSSKGFSSSVPVQSNTTVAGRISNRRVEFIVEVIIVSEGNTP